MNLDGQPQQSTVVTFNDIRNRVGRFSVSRELAENDLHTVLSLLRGKLIARAELRVWQDEIVYEAFSADFDEVAPSEQPPDYQALFTRNEDGSTTVEWRRVT